MGNSTNPLSREISPLASQEHGNEQQVQSMTPESMRLTQQRLLAEQRKIWLDAKRSIRK